MWGLLLASFESKSFKSKSWATCVTPSSLWSFCQREWSWKSSGNFSLLFLGKSSTDLPSLKRFLRSTSYFRLKLCGRQTLEFHSSSPVLYSCLARLSVRVSWITISKPNTSSVHSFLLFLSTHLTLLDTLSRGTTCRLWFWIRRKHRREVCPQTHSRLCFCANPSASLHPDSFSSFPSSHNGC